MKKETSKNPAIRFIMLLVPFLFLLAVLVMGCFLAYSLFSLYVPEYNALTMSFGASGETDLRSQEDVAEGEFPLINYEDQWATLTVDGWEKTAIPVYFGDNENILEKGVGQWQGSRFCGQNAQTVLCAHAASYFYELEDTAVGTRITMDTTYGKYVYRVTEIVYFNAKTDADLLENDNAKDQLFLYTCYPRDQIPNVTGDRLGLICEKVEGKEWDPYYD